jgi:hypothetical protein
MSKWAAAINGFLSVAQAGASVPATRMMGSGKTNAPQVAPGLVGRGYNTHNFPDLFAVTNTGGFGQKIISTPQQRNVPSSYRIECGSRRKNCSGGKVCHQ